MAYSYGIPIIWHINIMSVSYGGSFSYYVTNLVGSFPRADQLAVSSLKHNEVFTFEWDAGSQQVRQTSPILTGWLAIDQGRIYFTNADNTSGVIYDFTLEYYNSPTDNYSYPVEDGSRSFDGTVWQKDSVFGSGFEEYSQGAPLADPPLVAALTGNTRYIPFRVNCYLGDQTSVDLWLDLINIPTGITVQLGANAGFHGTVNEDNPYDLGDTEHQLLTDAPIGISFSLAIDEASSITHDLRQTGEGNGDFTIWLQVDYVGMPLLDPILFTQIRLVTKFG